jgi:hypothetical protein
MGNFFKDLSKASPFTQSKWFQPGNYVVEIQAVKFNSGGYKGDSFVIETKVLASKHTESNEAPKEGEIAAHIWKADGDKRDIARNTWMAFMEAVFATKAADKTDAEWEAIAEQVLDDNALAGTKMLLEVFNKKTRAGGDFTYHAWRRVATDEDLAAFGIGE